MGTVKQVAIIKLSRYDKLSINAKEVMPMKTEPDSSSYHRFSYLVKGLVGITLQLLPANFLV